MPDAIDGERMLLTRLFLDAQDELLRVIEQIPAPGRGGPIGSLNAPGAAVAHVVATHDTWIHRFCEAGPVDPWTEEWRRRVKESGPTYRPTLDEDVEAFQRIAASASTWVQQTSWDGLNQPGAFAGSAWEGTPKGYMVARAVAHIYTHAGELSVLASLMGAGDIGLPGPLLRSTVPTTPDDPSIPIVGALVRDGFVEMRRALEVTPTPAAAGAMDRLNPVSHTAAHLISREDRLWNVQRAGLEPSAPLAALGMTAEASPLPWEATIEAYRDVEQRVAPWLDALDGPTAAEPMDWRGTPSSVGAQVARSATHFFSHAGEAMAHASLYGVADLGMPGELAHVRAAFARG